MSDEHKLKIKKVILFLLVVTSLIIVFWAIFPYSAPEWTGFSEYDIDSSKAPIKKLWDWLDLLIIPVVLSVGLWYLRKSENDAIRQREDDKEQKEKRAKFEMNQREDFANYLSFMTELLLKHGLRKSNNEDEVRNLARAQTMNLIRNADNDRKSRVFQFLLESGLITKPSIISLVGADFSQIEFDNLDLSNTELKGVIFCGCSFIGTNFDNAELQGSIFSESVFDSTSLQNTNLFYATIENAKINDTDFSNSNTGQVIFTNSTFRNSITSPS